MKRHLSLLLLLICTNAFCKEADLAKYKSYPHVLTVAKYFNEHVVLRQYKGTYLELGRKPDGWSVLRKGLGGTVISEFQVWSLAQNRFLDTKEMKIRTPDNIEPSDDFESFNTTYIQGQYSYERCIYYGYRGWENDVINELEGCTNLTDSLYESLARGYENRCTELVRSQFGDYNKVSRSMTDADCAAFIASGNKLLEDYKQIEKMSPDYQTLIGDVHNKLSNMYVYLWEELDVKGRGKEGAQFMIPGLYDPLLIDWAKNLLVGCTPNAVLFANGDNDTFPLWYVQQQMGYRKDVAVLNRSLITIPDYVYYAKEHYPFFRLSIPAELYRDTLTDYIVVEPGSKKTVRFSELVADLNKNKDPDTRAGKSYYSISCEKLMLTVGTNSLTAPTAQFTAYYFYKSDLVVYDIIASANKAYDVYFTCTNGTGDIMKTLQPYLRSEGLLYKVTSVASGNKYGIDNDLVAMKKNINSSYHISVSGKNFKSAYGICASYDYMYYSYIDDQFTTGAKADAETMLNKWITISPPTDHTEANYVYYIATYYHKLEKDQLANKYFAMAIQIITNDKDPLNRQTNRQILGYILNDAKDFLTKENQAAAQKALDAMGEF